MWIQLIIIWIPELIPRGAANVPVFNKEIGHPIPEPDGTHHVLTSVVRGMQ